MINKHYSLKSLELYYVVFYVYWEEGWTGKQDSTLLNKSDKFRIQSSHKYLQNCCRNDCIELLGVTDTMIQQKKHKIQDELFKTQHSKDHAKKFMTDHNKLFNNYQLERDDALLNLRTWNEKILTMMKSYVKGKAFIREHSIKRRRTSNRIHNSNNNKNNSNNDKNNNNKNSNENNNNNNDNNNDNNDNNNNNDNKDNNSNTNSINDNNNNSVEG